MLKTLSCTLWMGELYGIETRKKTGHVLEDHSKTIRKASNTKATTTWWEKVTITKGDEFYYLLQSRTVQNVRVEYLRHLLEMLCLIFGNASICRIWDPIERRNRTRSKPGKDLWQKGEVWRSRKKPVKAGLILQNQAARAFLSRLTHLWGYSASCPIKQGLRSSWKYVRQQGSLCEFWSESLAEG